MLTFPSNCAPSCEAHALLVYTSCNSNGCDWIKYTACLTLSSLSTQQCSLIHQQTYIASRVDIFCNRD